MLKWILLPIAILFLDAIFLGIIATAYTGWILMISLVLLTSFVGILLVRSEGRRTIRKMQQSLTQGKAPTSELLDGGFLIIAGAFLLTPGLMTDSIGFLLTIPQTRTPIRRISKQHLILPYLTKNSIKIKPADEQTSGFPGGDASSDSARSESSSKGTYDLSDDSYTVNSNFNESEESSHSRAGDKD